MGLEDWNLEPPKFLGFPGGFGWVLDSSGEFPGRISASFPWWKYTTNNENHGKSMIFFNEPFHCQQTFRANPTKWWRKSIYTPKNQQWQWNIDFPLSCYFLRGTSFRGPTAPWQIPRFLHPGPGELYNFRMDESMNDEPINRGNLGAFEGKLWSYHLWRCWILSIRKSVVY